MAAGVSEVGAHGIGYTNEEIREFFDLGYDYPQPILGAFYAPREIPHLTGTDVEKGAVLQTLFGKMDAADAEKVLTMLKTGDKAVASLLGTEIGKHGEDNSDGTAISELNAKADEIKKADTKLTQQQAFRKACETNPDVYRRYQKERRTRAVQ